MEQPCEVETKFLSIVICDEIEWLHMFQETCSDKSSNELVFVLVKRLPDFMSIWFV